MSQIGAWPVSLTDVNPPKVTPAMVASVVSLLQVQPDAVELASALGIDLPAA